MSRCWKLITDDGVKLGYRFQVLGDSYIDVVTCKEYPNQGTLVMHKHKDDRWRTKDEACDVLEFDDLGATYVQYMDEYKITLLTGEVLPTRLLPFWEFNKRYVFKRLEGFVNEPKSKSCLIIGTRRTGKTVLMYHTIHYLIQSKGVHPSQIAYIRFSNTGVPEGKVQTLLSGLAKTDKIKYLFIDEITYCDTDLSFLQDFIDGLTAVKKTFLTGTYSSTLMVLAKTAFLGRSVYINTTYISYKEFHYLYPDKTIDDYLFYGGTMQDSVLYSNREDMSYEEYTKVGMDYIGSAIVSNIFSSFKNLDLHELYPIMSDLYASEGEGYLKMILLRLLQCYSLPFDRARLGKAFKFSDVGNLRDTGTRLVSDNSLNVFCDYLYDGLLEHFDIEKTGLLGTIGSKRLAEEFVRFLDDMGCFCSCPVIDCQYIIPLCVRTASTYEVIKYVDKNYVTLSEQSMVKLDLSVIRQKIFESLNGGLLEAAIYIDLWRAGKTYSKFGGRNGIPEVDLVYNGELYEIKHSDQIVPAQLKNLLSYEVLSEFNPTSVNVLYRGSPKSFTITPKALYQQLMGIVPDHFYVKQLTNASDQVYTVNYINAGDFLCSIKDSSKILKI